MRNRWLITLTFVLPLVFLSCDDDDDDAMPPIKLEYVEAFTDSKAVVDHIMTDGGDRLVPSSTITASKGDTIYRCLCQYAIEDGKCNVYGLKTIFSKKPVHRTPSDTLWTDPLRVSSVWKSARYVNLSLELLTTGQGAHAFAFYEDTILTDDQGKKTAYCSLSHHRIGRDPESYTENLYLSMPVYDYPSSSIDSVAVTVSTYTGPKRYKFKL